MLKFCKSGGELREIFTWAVVLGAAALCGCQAFAPAAVGTLSRTHNDKRIAKQAENDPFPSPADVGLGEQTEKP